MMKYYQQHFDSRFEKIDITYRIHYIVEIIT